MMSFVTNFGTIKGLTLEAKGYYRLVIGVNLPFKTKFLKFNVWKKELVVASTNELYKEGEEVLIEYYYRDNFPQLSAIKEAAIDYCPVCDSGLEQINAQRMECDGCSSIPVEEQKERINEKMRLISCIPKQYQYSTGYLVELLPPGKSKAYKVVVFPSNPPLFKLAPDLKVGQLYTVLAWRDKKLLDLIDIDYVPQ